MVLMLYLFTILYLGLNIDRSNKIHWAIHKTIGSMLDANYFALIATTCLEWNLLQMLIDFQRKVDLYEHNIKIEEHYKREKRIIILYIWGTFFLILIEMVY